MLDSEAKVLPSLDMSALVVESEVVVMMVLSVEVGPSEVVSKSPGVVDPSVLPVAPE